MMENKSQPSLTERLLTSENIQYNLPSNNSVVTHKTTAPFFPHGNTFTNNSAEMAFVMNTGSSYVDPSTAFISFKLTVPAAGGGATDFIDFGSGSAANIFSEVSFVSKSGETIESIRNVNLLSSILSQYNNSNDWFHNIGSVMGHSPDIVGDDDGKEDYGSRIKKIQSPEAFTASLIAGRTFCVPLSHLFGLFSSPSRTLIPSQLLSGARIEFKFAAPTTALRTYKANDGEGAHTLLSYTLTEVSIKMTTFKLTDSVMAQLNRNSSTGAMMIPVRTWFHQSDSGTNAASINISKNAGQVNSVLVKTRLTDDIADRKKDSMGSEPEFKYSEWQFRHGSNYDPVSKIKSAEETYMLAQIAFEKTKSSNSENNVSFFEFSSHGKGIIANDFERSSIDMSGVSVNQSKALVFEATFSDGEERTFDIFMNYTSVITVYLSNVLVVN